MGDIHKLSERVIEYAERASAMSDAAHGKKTIRRSPGGIRWFLLPAAGAGLYAVMRSPTFTRQAKETVTDAKSRAAGLPEELLGLVRQSSATPQTSPSRNGSKKRSTTSTSRRKTSSRA